MSKANVFISYAHDEADKRFAKELARLLEKRGVSVFDETRDVPFGDAWLSAIRDQIERSTALIVLIPSNIVSNRNSVWFEVGLAKALKKRVLAVLPPHRRISAEEVLTDLADVILLDADERPLERIADTLVQAAA